MAKLKTMEKVVLQVLEESPLARKDDYVLIWLVCQKLKPELVEKPFADVLYHHKALGLPNWETITRCRRKIQEKRPDLVAPETAKKRRKEEQEYIEYSHT